MAVKFYFPTGNFDFPIEPTGWGVTGGFTIGKAITYKPIEGFLDKTVIDRVADVNDGSLNRVYISDPIKSTIFTGLIKGQLSCWQSNPFAGYTTKLIINLIDNTGAFKKNILFYTPSLMDLSAVYVDNLTFSGQNRYCPISGSPNLITGIVGDRIEFQIGCQITNLNPAPFTGYQEFGASSNVQDLPENLTTDTFLNTASLNPWIEFNQDIEFLPPPTRFYYYTNKTPYKHVNPSTIWQVTGEYDCVAMGTGRDLTAIEYKSANENTNISNVPVLNRIYVSNPIKATVFSGTVKGQILCDQSSPSGDFVSQIRIKLCNNSGVQKSNIYTFQPTGADSSEFFYSNPPSGQNRSIPFSGMVNLVTGVSGDLIAVELGARGFNTISMPTFGFTQNFGTEAPDLPENNTYISNTGTPWLEFSMPISFV